LIKESYVKSWCDENSIKYDDKICLNKKLKDTILSQFKEIAIKEKKKTFEYITNIHLTDVEWTPENGLLTSAMKLNRQNLLSKFQNEIDDLYKDTN
jgi:long-chain acyl-CoA synthetase